MRSSACRYDLIKAVMELGFAAVDMNLYLDNNPEDKTAVNTYNSFVSQYTQARCAYEKKYGPLTNFGYSPSTCPWKWVEEPWPWEKEFYM